MADASLVPTTSIELFLAPWLLDALRGPELLTPLQRAVAQQTQQLADALGFATLPEVSIAALAPNSSGALLHAYVAGKRCRYPDELVRRVLSYINRELLSPDHTPSALAQQVQALASDPARLPELVDFVATLCAETFKRRPALLFGLEHAGALSDELPPPPGSDASWPPEPSWLHEIACTLLDLKLSLRDRACLSHELALRSVRSDAATIEALILALRPDHLQIHLNRDDLRAFTLGEHPLNAELFRSARENLFEELGIWYPDFAVRQDSGLAPGCFAVSINHMRSLPWVGLPAGRKLVRGTSVLDEQTKGLPVWMDGAGLVQPTRVRAVTGDGRAASGDEWDAPHYFALCFITTLRENAACFVSARFVDEEVEAPANWHLQPTLARPAFARAPRPELAAALRELAAQSISIRALHTVLEHMADLEPGTSLQAAVRAALSLAITHKCARGTRTVVAYLLDPKIEQQLASGAPTESDEDRLTKAIRAELAVLPPTAWLPFLLVDRRARDPLARLLRDELPQMSAISYDDLNQDTLVQPVARISW